MIVGDTTWLTSTQLKCAAVKKLIDQAGIKAHNKSQLRDLLETVIKMVC